MEVGSGPPDPYHFMLPFTLNPLHISLSMGFLKNTDKIKQNRIKNLWNNGGTF